MADEERSLNREFLTERDVQIYKLRAAGYSHEDIAKRFEMTVRAVTASINRQTRKLNKEASYSYPEVLRLELERLDIMQRNIWPLTQHRRITMDDGTELSVEPDLDAINTFLKIQERRSKMLGMDVNRVSIEQASDIRHNMHGAKQEDSEAIDQKSETLKILEAMTEARIIEQGVMDQVLGQLPEVVEAEIVDDSE